MVVFHSYVSLPEGELEDDTTYFRIFQEPSLK